MADPARHLHFNVNDDEIVHDNQGNDNQDDPISEVQAGQVVQQNVPVGAQTTLAFKVEQSKMSEF
jgi:hypothetical protein